MSDYSIHLVECQCVLSIFKNKTKPVYHKIPVFSIINESDELEQKYIMCENCNIIHHVTEITKSEIKWGVEGLESLINTKEDIKFNLESLGHERLATILEKEDMHVSDWEKAEFLLDKKNKGIIVLQKNEENNNIIIKFIDFDSGKYKIKKEIIQRYL